jgi:translation initiation factor 3 subunit A
VRLKAQEKKVDHMERAKRLEEIPLLKEQHEDLKAERKQVKLKFCFCF